jgi:hypothetical protein
MKVFVVREDAGAEAGEVMDTSTRERWKMPVFVETLTTPRKETPESVIGASLVGELRTSQASPKAR